MQFDIITLFPQCFDALHYGVLGQAIKKGLVRIHLHNPRAYTTSKHRQVDDRPYGGGPGMVMQYQPLADTLARIEKQAASKTILLSPSGAPFCHQHSIESLDLTQLILVCGRYEGIDQRFIDQHIDTIWSLGDFVLSGGEYAALAVIDSIARQVPDVLGHPESAAQDSFYHGLLDHPHYTRPECISNINVPKVLLSGDHQAITQWREQQALGKTWQMRPDLLKRHTLTTQQQQLLDDYIKQQE